MKLISKKVIGAVLAGIMGITTLSTVLSEDNVATVYAAESNAFKSAKAKISHLTKSLKTNYLGIKNQGIWELYIKQSRELISKIPNSEKVQRDALTIEVNNDEALVKALGRINQVEKSIAPKEQGGYGNHLGIRNAEVWNGYLKLAEEDLNKVDKIVFKKQYDELFSRMNKVKEVVKSIEDHFLSIYNHVLSTFEFAKEIKSRDILKYSLIELEGAGSCERSDKLKKEIEEYINSFPPGYVEDLSSNPNHKLYLEKAFKDLKISIRGEVYDLVVSEWDKNNYEINMSSKNDHKKILINKKTTDEMIVYGERDRTRRGAPSYYPLIMGAGYDLYRDDIIKRENLDFFEDLVVTSITDSRKIAYITCETEKYGKLTYKFVYSDKDNTITVTDN